MLSVLALISAVSGLFYFVFFVYERPPPPAWVHPTMPFAEQTKVKAECEMAAYDALGGGSGSVRDPTSSYRADYVAKCLTAKGFRLIERDAAE